MEEKKLDLMIRLLEEMLSRMKGGGDRLMSTKEVAERLGTGTPMVMNMIRTGMLPAIRFRTVSKIRKASFEKFLNDWDGKDILTEVDARMNASGGK